VSPVALFRVWRGQLLTMRLSAMYRHGTTYTWMPGPNAAYCSIDEAGCEEPPNEEHQLGCGFYGCYTLSALQQRYPEPETWVIRGVMLGWGKVLRCEWSARTRYAQVLCLIDDSERFRRRVRPARIEQLALFAQAYQVPLYPPDAVTLYAAEFGELLHPTAEAA
jgi:hypothetical protein